MTPLATVAIDNELSAIGRQIARRDTLEQELVNSAPLQLADEYKRHLKGKGAVTAARTAAEQAVAERNADLESARRRLIDMAAGPGGDKFLPTLNLMSKKLLALPQEKRNELLARIYGDEAQAAAGVLLDPEKMKQINERVKDYGNNEKLERNLDTFRNSRWASNQRAAILEDASLRGVDTATGEYTWSEVEKARYAARAARAEQGQGFFGGLVDSALMGVAGGGASHRVIRRRYAGQTGRATTR